MATTDIRCSIVQPHRLGSRADGCQLILVLAISVGVHGTNLCFAEASLQLLNTRRDQLTVQLCHFKPEGKSYRKEELKGAVFPQISLHSWQEKVYEPFGITWISA